jgi:TonB family protein
LKTRIDKEAFAMKQVLIASLTLLASATTALAQDEALPQDVASAYLDYQAALEVGDAMVLLDAGRRAYEAGDEADIDRATLATLAENYGFAASLNADYESAQEAWRIAGRLSDRADVDPVERAWRWHNAALVALHNQDRNDAYSCSRNAANALEELGDDLGAATEFAGDAFLTRAALAIGRGRLDDAGDAAVQSVAAFEASLDAPSQSYALALFYAGIAQTLDREFEDATYSLHVARDVLAEVAPDHVDTATLRAAYTSARLNLFEHDEVGTREALDRLEARLAANPFHPALPATDEPDIGSDPNDESEPEACCDAEPISRRMPNYPRDAAYSNLDGVVYVSFDVTATGRTRNIRIIGSFPPAIFDATSVSAVEDWRYEPATRDGEPILREGVETRFDFRMQR